MVIVTSVSKQKPERVKPESLFADAGLKLFSAHPVIEQIRDAVRASMMTGIIRIRGIIVSFML